jgi:hypothetical protein
MPGRVFGAAMFYLVALIALFIAYEAGDGLRDLLPEQLGPLPIGVVWFGSVGAVLSGLGGIYYHNQKWDPAYTYWHYSRPFVGAVVGGVGALLYYVSVSLGTEGNVEPDPLTFDAVAFILGFADSAFRQLITNVTSLLFRQANPPEGRTSGPGAPPTLKPADPPTAK